MSFFFTDKNELTSWGRAVPSSGEARLARNCGNFQLIKEWRSSSIYLEIEVVFHLP
jgi:hypothetical protein